MLYRPKLKALQTEENLAPRQFNFRAPKSLAVKTRMFYFSPSFHSHAVCDLWTSEGYSLWESMEHQTAAIKERIKWRARSPTEPTDVTKCVVQLLSVSRKAMECKQGAGRDAHAEANVRQHILNTGGYSRRLVTTSGEEEDSRNWTEEPLNANLAFYHWTWPPSQHKLETSLKTGVSTSTEWIIRVLLIFWTKIWQWLQMGVFQGRQSTFLHMISPLSAPPPPRGWHIFIICMHTDPF